MAGEEGHIFEVQHGWPARPFGGSIPVKGYLHHVETDRAGRPVQSAEIGACGPQQHLFLSGIHREVPRHEGVGGPRLYFDKYEHLTVRADEIEFLASVGWVTPVPGQHAPAPCGEGLSRESFRPGAGRWRVGR